MNKETKPDFYQLTLSQKIQWFRTNKGKYIKTDNNEPWYSVIQKELMLATYELPSKTKLISVQEISGFLLYSIDYYQELVNSFNPKRASWDTYFQNFMKNRYLNYIKPKQIAKKKEEIILFSHFSYEYQLEQEDQTSQDELLLCENANTGYSTEQKKLIYILKKSLTARKRLFIFILACAPILGNDILKSLCRFLSIDFKETKHLVDKTVKRKDLERIENRIQLINSRRNYNYSQALIYRQRFCDATDEKTKYELDLKHQRNLDILEQRNDDITKIDNKTSQITLAQVLGLKRGTVSSSITNAKYMLEFCLGSSSHDLSSLVPNKVALELKSGRWLREYQNLDPLDIFYPSKVFTIV